MFARLSPHEDIAHAFENFFETKYYNLGHFTARKPCLVFCVAAFLSLVCTAGMGFVTTASAIVDLWVPADAPAKANYDFIEETFANPAQECSVIITAKNGVDDVLNEEHFNILWDIQEATKEVTVEFTGDKKTYNYTDLCFRDPMGYCKEVGALGFWSFNKYDFDSSSSDILTDLAIDTYPRDGTPVIYNPYSFGKITLDGNEDITGAKAMKMSFFLKNPKDTCVDEYDCAELEWQTEWIAKMEKFVQSKSSQADIYYLAARSLDDELAAAIFADIPLVGAAYLIMIFVCCFSLGGGIRQFPRDSNIALGLGGILCVLLSTLAGFGIAAACGAWFTSLHALLPFILLGIGVDDTYIIVNSYSHSHGESLEDKIGNTLRQAGIPIMYTSTTDFIAFLLGATSSLPGISSFCVYAAISIFADFLLQITFFVAILVWDIRRAEAKKKDCCCCFALPEDTRDVREKVAKRSSGSFMGVVNPSEIEIRTVADALEYLAVLLNKYWLGIIIAFLSYLGVSIHLATQNTEGFDPNTLVLDDSHFRAYNTANKEYGTSTYDVIAPVGIYHKRLDYYKADVQVDILDLNNRAVEALDHTQGEIVCWLDYFLAYLPSTDLCSTTCDFSSTGYDFPDEEAFLSYLNTFLSLEDYKSLSLDVALDDDGKVASSRSWMFHHDIGSVKNQIKAMDEMVDFIDENKDQFSSDPFADSWIYVYVYQYKVLPRELTQNFILVLVSIIIASPIVLKHPLATILLLFIVIMIDVELLGMVHALGLDINSFSALSLVMAVGLVVDYNAHLTHAFFTMDPEGSKEERMRGAMRHMGRSVLFGGLTSFMGLIPLAFSQCEVFRVFFKMTLSIVLLGMLHGILFGPTMLMRLPFDSPDSMLDSHKRWRGVSTDKGTINSAKKFKAKSIVYKPAEEKEPKDVLGDDDNAI